MPAVVVSSALLDVSVVDRRVVVVSATVGIGEAELADVVWDGDVARVAGEVVSPGLDERAVVVLRSDVLVRVDVEVAVSVDVGADVV